MPQCVVYRPFYLPIESLTLHLQGTHTWHVSQPPTVDTERSDVCASRQARKKAKAKTKKLSNDWIVRPIVSCLVLCLHHLHHRPSFEMDDGHMASWAMLWPRNQGKTFGRPGKKMLHPKLCRGNRGMEIHAKFIQIHQTGWKHHPKSAQKPHFSFPCGGFMHFALHQLTASAGPFEKQNIWGHCLVQQKTKHKHRILHLGSLHIWTFGQPKNKRS